MRFGLSRLAVCMRVWVLIFFCVVRVARSPDPESARASMGGWGLGLGREEKPTEEDDEDENLDWDQAQVSCRLETSS